MFQGRWSPCGSCCVVDSPIRGLFEIGCDMSEVDLRRGLRMIAADRADEAVAMIDADVRPVAEHGGGSRLEFSHRVFSWNVLQCPVCITILLSQFAGWAAQSRRYSFC